METKDEFSNLMLKNFPQPIAQIYSLMETSNDWEEKTRLGFQLFEFSLRYYTLLAASQYLYRTTGVNDQRVDASLLNFLQVGEKTLGLIQETLFSLLKTQRGHENQFYIKEMYEWYWDTSYSPHRPKKGIGTAFGEIIQLRNKIIHFKVIPQTDNEWKEYYSQMFSLLNNSIGKLTFLKNYRLVRIDNIDSGIIECKDFTGIHPINEPIRVKVQDNEKVPRGGWLFVSHLQSDYLQVHPLIVFLQGDDIGKPGEIALLENFGAREATYARPGFGNIRTVDIINDILTFVRTVLEERIGELVGFDTLSWENFRDATGIITTQKTLLLQDKFKPDLYLQRTDVQIEFERFIESNKTALVLLGNSGIGKSSFLTAMIRELSKESNFSILAYDGANLDPTQSITQLIDNDLRGLLRRREHRDISYLDDLPLKSNMEGKKVLILIDAVNENATPRELLFNINRFVIDYSRYTWLKILITSRPQAWRMMKRGVKLSDPNYYYPQNEQNPWHEILQFSWSEVPKVYENYHRKYELKTPYDELTAEIKANLRDPLFLLLVSQTWKGTRIPSTISTFEVYEKFLDTLILERVLQPADLDFLEDEIMPRLISWKKFQPSIPRKDLQAAFTSDRRPLLEMVENRDYADDAPINISFVHLVDVGLLEQRGNPREYEIRFKFERFFDYFGGKQLYKIVKEKQDPGEAYRLLLENTLRQPWLWGGVKNALILELNDKKYNLIAELFHTEDSYIKDLLVVVLEEFGETNKDAARTLLNSIFVYRKAFGSALFRRRKRSLAEQIAGKGAIEAAYRLDLLEIIQNGCLDIDPAVRSASIQQLWRYWRERDREGGFRAIQGIISKSIQFPNFSLDGLESAASASLLILFENSKDPVVTNMLRSIWKPVLQKVLIASPTSNKILQMAEKQIRNFMLILAVNLFTRVIKSGDDVKYWLNLQELRDFFLALDDADRESGNRLLAYIDPAYGDLDEVYSDFLRVAKTSNVLAWFLLVSVAVPHATQKPQAMVDFTNRVFSELVSLDIAPPATVLPTDVFGHGLDSNLFEKHPEWLEIYGEMAWKFVFNHRTKFASRITAYQYLMSGLYFEKYYQLYKTTESEFQRKYLEYMLQIADPELVKSYTRSFAISAVLKIPPRIAMQALLPVADYWKERIGSPDAETIEEILVEAFSIVRNFKPVDVDDFLLENDFPAGFQQRVKANTIENLGNVLGYTGARFVMNAYLAHPSKDRRDLIRLVFKEALASKSINRWLEKLIRIIVNEIYGETLFQTSSLTMNET